MGAKVFGYAAIGVAHVLVSLGWSRELQHILLALIDNGDLVAISPCIGFIPSGKVGEVNH